MEEVDVTSNSSSNNNIHIERRRDSSNRNNVALELHYQPELQNGEGEMVDWSEEMLKRNIKDLFEQCDYDHDGFVHLEDLKEMYLRSDLSQSSNEQIEIIFNSVKKDVEGKMSLDDFVTTMMPISKELYLLQKDYLSISSPTDSEVGAQFLNISKAMQALMSEAKLVLDSQPEYLSIHSNHHNFSSESDLLDEFSEDYKQLELRRTMFERETLHRIEILEKEKEKLLLDLDQFSRENQKLREKASEIDAALFAVQQENIRLKKRCFESTEEVFELKTDLDKKEEQNKEMAQELMKLKVEKSAEKFINELQKLENEKYQWLTKEKKYQTSLKELDIQLNSIKEDLQRDQQEFEERIKKLTNEQQSTLELERLVKERDLLEAQVHELHIHMNKGFDKRHIEPLQAVINSLTVEVKELKDENMNLKNTLQNYRQNIIFRSIQESNLPLDSPSRANTLENTPLEKQLQDLKDENVGMKNYLDRLLTQIFLRDDLLYLLQK